MESYPTSRDRLLADDLRDLLATDPRLAGSTLEVALRGGVAHLQGSVAEPGQREWLRRAAARVKGVHAVWDRVRAPEEPALRLIDIGCGGRKQYPEALGLDRHPYPGVDLVADAARALPLADGSVDHAFAVHFLEHVADLIRLMNDIHRVLKAGGVLHVLVPHWRFVNAVADPTHVRFFDVQTFKFFCRSYPGMAMWRPLCAANVGDTVFADLQPVKAGEEGVGEEELARFFD